MGFELIALIILLALSAFFSGTETGIFSLSDVRLKKIEAEGTKRANTLSKLLRNPKKILVSVLAGNLLVNILAASVSERLSYQWFQNWGLELSVLLMITLILVFGEITPKVIALYRSEKWSLLAVYPLKIIMFLVAPLNRLLIWMSDWIVHRIAPRESSHITTEELHTAVNVGRQTGALDPKESRMIKGIISLGKRTVKEFMRPRNEIFACEITEPMEVIYGKIRKRKFSRVPMYKDSLDKIVGVLYGKDLVMKEITQLRAIQIYDCVREPYFVPELMKGDHLLREFRKRRIHMAIVVDEFGDVSGLVTLEDVIEEIVGEVVDKEDITPLYELVDKNRICVKARMGLKDFNEVFNTHLEDVNAVTIGGFLINRMGKIPKIGERYNFSNLEFEILDAMRHSIEKMQITRIIPSEGE